MDIIDLLKPIADYLNFVVDLIALEGISPFIRLGLVSPVLVTFMVIGILIALGIRHSKAFPSYVENPILEPDLVSINNQKENESKLSDLIQNQGLVFFVVALTSAPLFHLSIICYSYLNQIVYGNFKDTINGIMAYNAIAFPIIAISGKITKIKTKYQNYHHPSSTLLKITGWIFVFIEIFGFVFLFTFIMHKIHNFNYIEITWITAIFYFLTILATIWIYKLIKLSIDFKSGKDPFLKEEENDSDEEED